MSFRSGRLAFLYEVSHYFVLLLTRLCLEARHCPRRHGYSGPTGWLLFIERESGWGNKIYYSDLLSNIWLKFTISPLQGAERSAPCTQTPQ